VNKLTTFFVLQVQLISILWAEVENGQHTLCRVRLGAFGRVCLLNGADKRGGWTLRILDMLYYITSQQGDAKRLKEPQERLLNG